MRNKQMPLLRERERESSRRLPGLRSCLAAFLICFFLPAHNASAQLPDVIVTVSTTTIVQGSSATIVLKKGTGNDVVVRLVLRPASAPAEIFDRGLRRGDVHSDVFHRTAERRVLSIKTFSNQDISMITRDTASTRPKSINRNTDFNVTLFSYTATQSDADATANFDYQDATGNTIDKDTEIMLPFTITATDPGIRLKIKVYLEGALRQAGLPSGKP